MSIVHNMSTSRTALTKAATIAAGALIGIAAYIAGGAGSHDAGAAESGFDAAPVRAAVVAYFDANPHADGEAVGFPQVYAFVQRYGQAAGGNVLVGATPDSAVAQAIAEILTGDGPQTFWTFAYADTAGGYHSQTCLRRDTAVVQFSCRESGL